MGGGGDAAVILHAAEEIRVLDDDAGGLVGQGLGEFIEVGIGALPRGDFDPFDVEVDAVGVDHAPEDRGDGAGDHHLAAAGDLDGHHHGFEQGGAAVVEAGVGNIHSGEAADGGLVFVDGLERALRGFGLIRGVGGEEFAAGSDRIHGGRDNVVVIAAANEIHEAGGVFGGKFLEMAEHFIFGFTFGDPVERGIREADAGLFPHFADAGKTGSAEHFGPVAVRVGNIRHDFTSFP